MACLAADPARAGQRRARGGGRARRAQPYFIADQGPSWRGDTVIVIAGGPSATDVDLKGCGRCARILGVNDGYRLAACDVVYSCDGAWWKARQGLSSTFQGLRIAHDAAACVAFPGIRQVAVARGHDQILIDPPGVVGDSGNSGFQAINLAVQFGAAKIILIGFDMRLDLGIHWHGKHGRGLNNPSERNVAKWRRILDGQAPRLAEFGVTVINCSAVSALEAFPKMSLTEALQC